MSCYTCLNQLSTSFYTWGNNLYCHTNCIPDNIDTNNTPKYKMGLYNDEWNFMNYLSAQNCHLPLWNDRQKTCEKCYCNLSRYPYPIINININKLSNKFNDSVYCEKKCIDGLKEKSLRKAGAIYNKITNWDNLPKIDLSNTSHSGTGYPYCSPEQMKGNSVCFGHFEGRPAFCIQYAPINDLTKKNVMVIIQRYSDSDYLWVKSGGDCTIFSNSVALSMTDLDEIADFIKNGGNEKYKLVE